MNLLAICRYANRSEVKRVQVTQPLQRELAGLFREQANQFFDGVEEEVEFTGSWRPEPDELLTVDVPQNAQFILDAAAAPILSLPIVDANHIEAERIVGLYVVETDDGGALRQILIQPFSAQQILRRGRVLFLQGDVFSELIGPAFTLASNLVAVIEGGRIKFKSYSNLRKIVDVAHLYTEATDAEIDAFCAHERIEVADPIALKAAADQTIRKLIHAITATGALTANDAATISAKAAEFGIALTINNNKVVLPTDRPTLKSICKFLDNSIYLGALDSVRYQTNSKRAW